LQPGSVDYKECEQWHDLTYRAISHLHPIEVNELKKFCRIRWRILRSWAITGFKKFNEM